MIRAPSNQELRPVVSSRFDSDTNVLRQLLEDAGLGTFLSSWRPEEGAFVLIKPNLVNASPFPVTTPKWIVEGLVDFIHGIDPSITIVVAEGTGDPDTETMDLFRIHGYTSIKRVDFVDLNREDCKEYKLPNGLRWKSLFLPRVLESAFIISVPVLKAHTLAGVTLCMKNMIGVCPPKHFQNGGFWRKSSFHQRIHESIFDLNCAVKPHFCLLDATVGMSSGHLSGPTCSPLANRLVAGFDPVAVDALGAWLLGRNWYDIKHIRLANKVLGEATVWQTSNNM